MRNKGLYNFTQYIFLIANSGTVDELSLIDECITEDTENLNANEVLELCDLLELKLTLL